MNRVTEVMAVMALAVMACGLEFTGGSPTPSGSASGTPPPTMRIGIISLTPSIKTVIIASEGMRLRDRPDAAGPVDSVQLTIMHPGDHFMAESCQEVAGNWWAFGTYVSRETLKGWANAEFLSPNPCEAK